MLTVPAKLKEAFIKNRKICRVIIAVLGVLIIAAGIIYYVKFSGRVYFVGGRGPGGGWVFYDKGSYSDGWRYLEAGPADLCLSVRWNNGKDVETGATDTALGSGRSNTDKIIKVQGNGRYAAKLCDDYTNNMRGDWYLPSSDELNLMYENLYKKGIGGFTEFLYISSSEVNLIRVRGQWFKEGNKSEYCSKSFGPHAVRPVQAF